MIPFSLMAGLLVIAALAALLWPLLRRPDRAETGEPVLAVFRQQLADLDAELAQGALSPEEAATARTEITRHLLGAAGREREAAPADAGETAWRVGAAAAIAALVPLAAFVLYFAVGTPAALNPAAATVTAAPHSREELAAAAASLTRELEKKPDDIDRWMLLGRTLIALGHYDGARDAFGHAVALAPGDPELHAALGEALVLASGGTVTPTAAAEFAKAPNDLRSRYYGAEAALQRGDKAAAKKGLEALLADAPPDAPWRDFVTRQLARLETKPAAPASGPEAQGAAAAATMTPQQQNAMIAGMVGRLAARLDANPNDAKGWLMLARSYQVLGRGDDALKALQRATSAVPGNLPLLTAYLDALAGRGGEAAPSPELIGIAAKINALDDKQPEALWYLGLAAAGHGDRKAATGYWSRLLAELPADAPQRAVLQQRLDALR